MTGSVNGGPVDCLGTATETVEPPEWSQLDAVRGVTAVFDRERAVFAQVQAGAMISLLQWWMRRGMKEEPAEMDDLFHRMFWKGADAGS